MMTVRMYSQYFHSLYFLSFKDCNDHRLMGTWERGIVVQDGAKVINCHTIGFHEGIVLGNGNNAIHDSSATNAESAGIVISADDGCMSLEGVESSGNEYGLSYSGSGTTVWLKDSIFSDNLQAGITSHGNEYFCLTMEDVRVKGNKNTGLSVTTSQNGSIQISNSEFVSNTQVGVVVDESSSLQVTLDNVSVFASRKSNLSFKGSDLLVALYGTVQSSAVVADMGDGSFSYTVRVGWCMYVERIRHACLMFILCSAKQSLGGSSVLEVWGSLDVFGNQLGGIGLISIDLAIMESGSITACQNNASRGDITMEYGSILTGADRLVCDSFNESPCATTCDRATGSAVACTVDP